MKSKYTLSLFFLLIAPLVACESTPYSSAKKMVSIEFITDPAHTDIRIGQLLGSAEKQCAKAPCVHDLWTNQLSTVTATKEGYRKQHHIEKYLLDKKGETLYRMELYYPDRPQSIERLSKTNGNFLYKIKLEPTDSTKSKEHLPSRIPFQSNIKNTCETDWATADKFSREAIPCYRPAGIMPPQAERSGTCSFRYDFSREGIVYNVAVLSCSEKIFAQPTISAVMNWRYVPTVKDGVTVATIGAESNMTYFLRDEKDRVIPILDSE